MRQLNFIKKMGRKKISTRDVHNAEKAYEEAVKLRHFYKIYRLQKKHLRQLKPNYSA